MNPSPTYRQIEKAIVFLQENHRQQPSLEEVAGHIGLSPAHFQRVFSEWAGVSPKKFLQYLTHTHARRLLRPQQATLFEAAYETGLSGTGRLHDLFVRLEAMTPGEYKNGGENLTISYNFLPSPYGPLLAAATARGLCFLGFADDPEQAFAELRHRYPNATFLQEKSPVEEQLIAFFEEKTTTSGPLHLHLKGTDFQLKVWEMLLKIPEGQASTYGELARQLGSPGASRAVGTAVGDNPVAWLIPCHRVIQQSGALGGYHWGTARKQALLAREAARSESMKT